MTPVFRNILACVLAGLSLLLIGSAAHAQAQRTFVSTSGDDANTASNCAPTTPCRSFGAAIGVTNAGGEIVPLTSGGYGPVTIAKSLQITTPPGVYAGITTGSGHGITVTAGSTDTVVLKGLTLNGLGTSSSLIQALSVGTLHVESCEVTNSGSTGIEIFLSNAGSVFVKDTIVRDSRSDGLFFGTSGPTLAVVVDTSRSEGNGASGFAIYPGKVSLNRIVAARNRDGVFAFAGGEVSCDGCIVNNNTRWGFLAYGGGLFHLTRSTVTNNGEEGISNGGGTFETFGTNMVRGNNGGGAQTSGTITTVPSL